MRRFEIYNTSRAPDSSFLNDNQEGGVSATEPVFAAWSSRNVGEGGNLHAVYGVGVDLDAAVHAVVSADRTVLGA